jgi:hypothetical protein
MESCRIKSVFDKLNSVIYAEAISQYNWMCWFRLCLQKVHDKRNSQVGSQRWHIQHELNEQNAFKHPGFKLDTLGNLHKSLHFITEGSMHSDCIRCCCCCCCCNVQLKLKDCYHVHASRRRTGMMKSIAEV